ncbi:hypothetical protein [Plasticicumulans sp.]|uniref:hypothetical protein n=1 Tax=Plasticicumulans sp. TaxID=2307179 RepID=UPI003962FFC8
MQPLDSRRAENIAGDLAAVLDTLRTLTDADLAKVLKHLHPSERRQLDRQWLRLHRPH